MDLVQKRAHVPGAVEPRSFEDALRELMHDSPFFVVSALFHAILLLLFAVAPAEPQKDPERVLIASAPDEPPPPLPPPPPPPPPLDVPDVPIEHPEIRDEPSEQPREDVSDVHAVAVADSHDVNKSIIGLGDGPPPGSGGPPGKLSGRGPPGGPVPVVESVRDALDWLARHQDEDGSWSCAGFDAQCEQSPACDGLGSPEFDVGVTGLAVLAFLGAAETPKQGRYREHVRRGLRFLADAQAPDGNFGNSNLSRHTYDHIIATLAMVEAFALTRDRIYRRPAEDGLAHLYRIRNPGGAWRYAGFHPDMALAPNDVSVTGWAIMAMTSARDCGLPFDKDSLEDAMLFLDEMTDPATGITGYTARGGRPARMEGAMAEHWPAEQSESMTAVAVLCRIFADEDLQRPGARDLVDKGAAVLARVRPLWSDDRPGRRDYYSWYYGSYALFQVGGQPWRDWEVTLVPAVARHQLDTGDARGSWDPQHDPWGGEGGRVYSTAILALTMEVFSRYPTVLGAH